MIEIPLEHKFTWKRIDGGKSGRKISTEETYPVRVFEGICTGYSLFDDMGSLDIALRSTESDISRSFKYFLLENEEEQLIRERVLNIMAATTCKYPICVDLFADERYGLFYFDPPIPERLRGNELYDWMIGTRV